MQLSDPIRKFLDKPNLAVLATVSPSGRPQATPVWFMVDGDEILINTAKGRVKLQNLKAHPHVALAVYDRDDPYQHVQIRGKVVKLDEEHGARDIDRLSMRYRGQPYKYQPGVTPSDRVSIRIKPTGLTSGGIR